MTHATTNTKVRDEQPRDPEWREKYLKFTMPMGSQKQNQDIIKIVLKKILIFTQSLLIAIAVGSTKDLIMKFWVGVGALKSWSKPKPTVFWAVNRQNVLIEYSQYQQE